MEITMENTNKEEMKFFEIIKSTGTKKISVNLSNETIEKIDEIAAGLRITRTLVIESIMMTGLKPYLELIKNANKRIRSIKAYQEPKKAKELDNMIEIIANFREKWKI